MGSALSGYYDNLQTGLTNFAYALTYTSFFYIENNHQMIPSCPLCIESFFL